MLATLRQRDFALLWLAGLISMAGSLALWVALPLHVYSLTGSTLATATTLAATVLPRVIGSSLAGVFVDRWDRKRIMIAADLARALCLLPLLLAPNNLALVYAISVLLGTIGLFFRPAESALLPLLVGEDRLVSANALNALNDNLGMLTGPALGALLYASGGIGGVVVADAATFLLSALLISAIRGGRRATAPHTPPDRPSSWRQLSGEWRAGLGLIGQDQSLRGLFIATSLDGAADGVYVTLGLAPLVLTVLGGTAAQVGWIATAQSLGGVLAGAVIARIGARFTSRSLLVSGMMGTGLADLGAANARLFAPPGLPAVSVALGWSALAGFPVVALGTGRQALIQAHTTDDYRGRVFGAFSAVQGAALLLGFMLGGLLGERLGLVLLLSAGGLLRVLAGLIALWLLPRQPHSSDPAGNASDSRQSA